MTKAWRRLVALFFGVCLLSTAFPVQILAGAPSLPASSSAQATFTSTDVALRNVKQTQFGTVSLDIVNTTAAPQNGWVRVIGYDTKGNPFDEETSTRLELKPGETRTDMHLYLVSSVVRTDAYWIPDTAAAGPPGIYLLNKVDMHNITAEVVVDLRNQTGESVAGWVRVIGYDMNGNPFDEETSSRLELKPEETRTDVHLNLVSSVVRTDAYWIPDMSAAGPPGVYLLNKMDMHNITAEVVVDLRNQTGESVAGWVRVIGYDTNGNSIGEAITRLELMPEETRTDVHLNLVVRVVRTDVYWIPDDGSNAAGQSATTADELNPLDTHQSQTGRTAQPFLLPRGTVSSQTPTPGEFTEPTSSGTSASTQPSATSDADATSAGPVGYNIPLEVQTCSGNVTGPEVTRSVGRVTVSGNHVSKQGDGSEVFCGWMTVGGTLQVDGKLTIDPSGQVASGQGLGSVHLSEMGKNGRAYLFNSSFTLDGGGNLRITRQGPGSKLLGFPLQVRGLSLSDGGVTISAGDLRLPRLLDPSPLPIKDLTFKDGRVSFAITFRIPDSAVAAGLASEGFTNGLGMRDVQITLDSAGVVGSGTLDLGPIGLQADIGFRDGGLDELGGGFDGLQKPLGGTGLFLQRLYFQASGLQVPPLTFEIQSDISGGPEVDGVAILKAKDLTGKISLDGSWGLSGSLYLAGVIPLADAEMNWQQAAGFYARGDINALDALIGDLWIRVDGSDFYGSGGGILQVPEGIPLLGGYQLAGARFTVDRQQVTAAAKLGQLVGTCRLPWQGNLHCSPGASKLLSRGRYHTPLLASIGGLPAGVTGESFSIPQGEQQVVVRLTWDQGDTDFTLTAPDGTVITPADGPADSQTINYFKKLDKKEAFYVLTPPQSGSWRTNLTTPDPTATYNLEVLGIQLPPTLSVTASPATGTTNGPVSIEWQSSAPIGSTVSLYYDTDGTKYDGIMIATGLDVSGSYQWDISPLMNATYHVYAMVTNGENAPVLAYAADIVEVANPRNPGVPQNLTAKAVNGALELAWQPGSGGTPAGYRVQILGPKPQFQAVGTATSFKWTGLTNDQNYTVAVSAYDTNGRTTAASAPAQVYLPAPHPPTLKVIWPAGDATNQQTVTITGQAEAGATVRLLRDGEVVADGLSGSFNISVPLRAGENYLSVEAAKQNGDAAEQHHTYLLDQDAPYLKLLGLSQAMRVDGSSVIIQGTIEVGATVNVNSKPVNVAANGRFSEILPLQAGPNQVAIVAHDAAGNEASFDGVITATGACGHRFPDVTEQVPGCAAVEQLAAMNAINGYPDGTFQPEKSVTRAEFAKMLVATLGIPRNPVGLLPFRDVKEHWSAQLGYLGPVVALKAINGFPDGTFRPDDPVTRAEMVKIVAAAMGLTPQGTPDYSDVDPASWYAGWAAAAQGSRLIGNKSPSPLWQLRAFEGNRTATRIEAAQILSNMLQSNVSR